MLLQKIDNHDRPQIIQPYRKQLHKQIQSYGIPNKCAQSFRYSHAARIYAHTHTVSALRALAAIAVHLHCQYCSQLGRVRIASQKVVYPSNYFCFLLGEWKKRDIPVLLGIVNGNLIHTHAYTESSLKFEHTVSQKKKDKESAHIHVEGKASLLNHIVYICIYSFQCSPIVVRAIGQASCQKKIFQVFKDQLFIYAVKERMKIGLWQCAPKTSLIK